MEHFLTVGRIPFLVCAPFFHRFLDNPVPKTRFLDGTPSEQNKRLRDGSIMLSPSSSIEYAKNQENYVICNRFCTSSTLEIRSVKLFSRYKWEDLGEKSVHLTEESDTSAVLLKLLSSHRFKVCPSWHGGDFSTESHDARLLIGDRALREGSENKWEFAYDLASVWQDWQNMPFVFGLWIIRKEALGGGLLPLLENYLDETEISIRDFKENRQECLQKWERHYPHGLPHALACDYYNAVDYSFTAEHEKSLKKFYELCGTRVKLKFI
ncbi:MAG: menaquinone biosynthesis protein [Fibromonadaceae bacterium]|jgi:chorismate dehydratase|nr:menaquinone biosynthesis protein [Fibromonadaceae bacterium]